MSGFARGGVIAGARPGDDSVPLLLGGRCDYAYPQRQGVQAGTNAAGIWVTSGPGMPCGARKLGDVVMGIPLPGRVWLDVCMLGQHLPQMYQDSELHELTPDGCARLGLCADCLGFGDVCQQPVTNIVQAARGIDQLKHPCPGCAGSGRPALRITVTRGPASTHGDARPLTHAYVPPLSGSGPGLSAASCAPEGMCLACGAAQDGTGPHGEVLHT